MSTEASVTGIPHASIADDVYNGMFIPKGAAIISNATYVQWSELSSPSVTKPRASTQSSQHGRERT